jgi:uncharacterized protein (DUF427 family)
MPQQDIKMEYITRNKDQNSFCEWKGSCTYWDLNVNGKRLEAKIFSYENPTDRFKNIKGYLSFYATPMDGCYVDGEKVTPQVNDLVILLIHVARIFLQWMDHERN